MGKIESSIIKRLESLKKLEKYNKKYYDELLMAYVDKKDEKKIGELLTQIDLELKNIRKLTSPKWARNQKSWNDPESHFREIEYEEVMDLKKEFDDNLDLFRLASFVNYKPVMTTKFVIMIKNLSDIRQRTNIRTARSEKMWNDPQAHLMAVKQEEAADLKNEITDLMNLYNIAISENHTEGVELITSRLNKIAPDLVDSLIPQNNGTMHK